ncbi:hypothetical protein CCB81_02495 [Armatimonadetes bacterium Uphvl-Ar2]|jgi:hypothetical protein|nr:hypothetical protein CCB81_02495 [Armatimonadetes bacterium Uphvl-Ar2]
MRKAHLLAALALPLGLAVACQSQTVGQAPLEDDPVFVGAEKTVVSPVGEPWTMYYFANETQDSLKDKLAGAAFFSSLGFEPFEKLATGEFKSSRKGRSAAEKTLMITVYVGKRNPADNSQASPDGATALIVQ